MRLRKILTVAVATGALFTALTVAPAQAATNFCNGSSEISS